MRAWKKMVIGTLAAATVAGGANLAAMAGTNEDRPARQESRIGDVRREDRQADSRENEVRGREAEGEIEAGDDRHEDEARGREAEGEIEAGDDSGMNSGRDDSGHHGRDGR